ncbi:Ger(x)C family spore germination protein [Gorillibacterium sp. sgz5001074]|uniref:Ger(x)C family spore germination protein n=1 Tax=Gorillibacterium sp. sgz5001074 TaxID=3446695 RepID=UPI003F66603D
MNPKRSLLLLLSSVMLLAAGCWNSRELKDMAIVSAVAIDTVPGSSKYRVSFQVVNSGQVAPKTVSGGSNAAAPVNVITGEGDTLFETIRRTSQRVPRQLFFAHVQLVVVSEDFAKKGMAELLDFFERSRETRLLSSVLIARESYASQILKSLTPLETIPAVSVVGKIGHASRLWSNSLHTRIDDVLDMMDGEERVTLISGVELLGQKTRSAKSESTQSSELSAYTQIMGIAVLDQGKLIFWVDEPEARGVLWVRGQVKSTVLTLDLPEKSRSVSVEITRSKVRVSPEVRDGRLRVKIAVSAEGAVTELKTPVDVTKPEEIRKLEALLAGQIREEIMSAIRKAQEKKVDLFMLGSRLNRSDPRLWRELKPDWKSYVGNSEMEVQVEAYIRNQGMRNKSHLSTLQK